MARFLVTCIMSHLLGAFFEFIPNLQEFNFTKFACIRLFFARHAFFRLRRGCIGCITPPLYNPTPGFVDGVSYKAGKSDTPLSHRWAI
jgi:hypothetical protein